MSQGKVIAGITRVARITTYVKKMSKCLNGKSAPDGRLSGTDRAAARETIPLMPVQLTAVTTLWSMLAVGFFNSIMFPSIFTLGIAELGPLTGTGSGLINMAIVGGAIVPVMQGAIADRLGIHHAFILPVVCYLYILLYALKGSRPNSERYQEN
jgi:fucose permease